MEFGKKLEVGNFTLLKYKKKDRAHIKIETVSKEWSLEYGEGSGMFYMFDNHPVEDDMYNPLMLLLLNSFYASTLLDAGYQSDLFNCIGKLLSKPEEDISEEEDARIIEDLKKQFGDGE